jgi:putative DNA primase/helicase
MGVSISDDYFGPDGSTIAQHGEQHTGQARIAYRLAEAYSDRLMHVYGLGWHVFDGKRWIEDHRGEAKRAVLDVLRSALADSLDDQQLRKDVRRCESAAGVAGVLDLAAALEPFAATVTDLDADAYLLNTAGGTLDLRTLMLTPHDPRDRITKVTRGAYVPDEIGSAWPKFLERVLPDEEVRGFLQRLTGVGLLGVVVEQVLAILTGTGANGKGVFYGAMGHALGDYATVAEPDLFMHREGAHPTGEMDLRGVRWVVVSESDKDRRLAEATMKRLTGGDEIKARRMRQDFISFKPSHTPLLVTNHLPKVSGDDPALWRRMRVIPFDVVIPPEERDPHLAEQLQLEADAILTFAVEGYREYVIRGRLDEPESVTVATNDYQRASDAIARFLSECCLINPHAYTTTADAFERWARWAMEDGAEPMSQKAFGQALDSRGYPAGPGGRAGRKRRGLGLLTDDEEGE